jgi:hypothetical protein
MRESRPKDSMGRWDVNLGQSTRGPRYITVADNNFIEQASLGPVRYVFDEDLRVAPSVRQNGVGWIVLPRKSVKTSLPSAL